MLLLNHYQRTRLLLIVGAIISLVIFWFVSRTLHVPFYVHHQGSLLRGPDAALSVFIILLALLVCTLLGSLIAGWVRFDAGLFIASIGLGIISIRGGSTAQMLRTAADAIANPTAPASPTVLLTLAGEMVVLFALIAIAWGGQWALRWRGWLKADSVRDGFVPETGTLIDRITALAVQVMAMGALMLLLCRSDAKAQTLVSVALTSYIATLIAHGVFAVRPSIWFWSGPFIVGLLGYALSYFNGAGWRLGELHWLLAPLARPLPLDYASWGVAASILGYWTSRNWQREQEMATPQQTKTAS